MPASNSFLSGLKDNILGTRDKASLFIVTTGRVSTAPGGTGLQQLGKVTEKALGDSMSSVPGAAGAVPGLGAGGSTYEFKVQFNPSTLSFSANADPVEMKRPEDRVDDYVMPTQMTRPASVTLSVDLIFDAVNAKDSFMADKFRLSPTDLAKGIASAVQNAREPYSVQWKINGLIAAAYDMNSRVIVFRWADMSFAGEIINMNVSYTMFSPTGRPVRGVVNMILGQKISSKTDYAYWQGAIDKCFGTAANGSTVSGGKSTQEKMGNLLNVGFM